MGEQKRERKRLKRLEQAALALALGVEAKDAAQRAFVKAFPGGSMVHISRGQFSGEVMVEAHLGDYQLTVSNPKTGKFYKIVARDIEGWGEWVHHASENLGIVRAERTQAPLDAKGLYRLLRR
jgi:hypothetical protein